MSWEFGMLNYIARFHNNILDSIMIFISSLNNNGYICIAATFILLCSRKYRKIGLTCVAALIIMQISGNMIIKPALERLRPYEINRVDLLIPTPKGSSFPSGHTYSAFAWAMSIFMWNRKWGTVSLIFAALIGFSRMYLYVHFPTDVLGGAVLGVADGIICYFVFKNFILTRANS